MLYVVYAIGLQEDLKPPYDNCYIGVTNKPEKRWKAHIKSKYRIGTFLREHCDLSYHNNMIIIFRGNEEDCFIIENMYRPNPNMGLNEAIGGNGGHTKYTDKRNNILSKKLKGRKITWNDKISETKKKNKTHTGGKNVKAKKWILISPYGEKIKIHGNLVQTCKKLNLLPSCLSYYRGKCVPDLSRGYGGYRAKSENSSFLRKNTSGWKLIENDGD